MCCLLGSVQHSCAFAGQGTTPHTTPVMLAASRGIALALSRSLLSEHSQAESKPGSFSTKLLLIFVGPVCCSIFT